MAVGALNYIILTANGSIASGDTAITFNEAVPSSGYPFMLVVATPFEIMKANSQASTYVINVTRRQEGTTNTSTIADDTKFVCELTHESLDDVYGELLDAEKIISGNETTASRTGRTPDINEITLDTDLDKVFIGVDGSPNTWEELCMESHSDYSNLLSSTGHTQYYTDTRADTWHANLSGEHLNTVDHDHSTVPAANMRDLTSEPSDTSTGGVYYHKTNKTIYYYDGAEWKQYNTVPQHAMIFRDDGSCPDGWTEKTAWDGYFLKGETASVWAGGSGGSTTHTHLLSTIPQHAHTIPDRTVVVDAVANHTHTITTYNSGSTYNHFNKQTDYSEPMVVSTEGAHTHIITVPEHSTNSGGTSGAESQSASSIPKYVELTLCEKN